MFDSLKEILSLREKKLKTFLTVVKSAGAVECIFLGRFTPDPDFLKKKNEKVCDC